MNLNYRGIYSNVIQKLYINKAKIDMDKISKLLICPTCRSILISTQSGFKCGLCGTLYPVKNKRINFLPIVVIAENDLLNKLKDLLKNFSSFYIFLSEVIAPVYVSKKILRKR